MRLFKEFKNHFIPSDRSLMLEKFPQFAHERGVMCSSFYQNLIGSMYFKQQLDIYLASSPELSIDEIPLHMSRAVSVVYNVPLYIYHKRSRSHYPIIIKGQQATADKVLIKRSSGKCGGLVLTGGLRGLILSTMTNPYISVLDDKTLSHGMSCNYFSQEILHDKDSPPYVHSADYEPMTSELLELQHMIMHSTIEWWESITNNDLIRNSVLLPQMLTQFGYSHELKASDFIVSEQLLQSSVYR